jgi:hypothetical protein
MTSEMGNHANPIYDPAGTSHLFDQLVYHALMLAVNFNEQIDGAPRELLEEWRFQLSEAEGLLAQIKSDFGVTP